MLHRALSYTTKPNLTKEQHKAWVRLGMDIAGQPSSASSFRRVSATFSGQNDD